MSDHHSLYITLHSDDSLRVGTNHLQLLIRNNRPEVAYEQITVWLRPPLGVRFNITKLEIAPFPTDPEITKPVTLTTTQPGTYPIKIRAEAIPWPEDGIFQRTQQIKVLPKLDRPSKSIEESFLNELSSLSDNNQNIDHEVRMSLQRQLADLLEDYEAANEQLGQTLDAVGRRRIRRQIEILEQEIQSIKRKLDRSPPKHYYPQEIDIFEQYRTGLKQLLDKLEREPDGYSQALSYQHQLIENIDRKERFGDTETLRSKRAEIIEQLNKLTRSHLGITFNKLCGL
jgi:hypothetical protein